MPKIGKEGLTRKIFAFDPDVIRTRNLLIWSQTRYRCATESWLRKLSPVNPYYNRLTYVVLTINMYSSLYCFIWGFDLL